MHIGINDFFDQIYVINLPHRKDRRREMELELARIGIDLPNSKVWFYPAVRPDEASGFPSIGARGCFLSHLGILKDAEARGLKRILILEDDTNFNGDFNLRISRILYHLGTIPWAIFYGSYRLTSTQPAAPIPDLCLVSAGESIGTSNFIAFQGDCIAGAARYLAAILGRPPGSPEGGPMHVDGAYCWFRRSNPQFQTVIARPELGYQRSSLSDIYGVRWHDRIPALSWLGKAVRAIKSMFLRLFR